MPKLNRSIYSNLPNRIARSGKTYRFTSAKQNKIYAAAYAKELVKDNFGKSYIIVRSVTMQGTKMYVIYLSK